MSAALSIIARRIDCTFSPFTLDIFIMCPLNYFYSYLSDPSTQERILIWSLHPIYIGLITRLFRRWFLIFNWYEKVQYRFISMFYFKANYIIYSMIFIHLKIIIIDEFAIIKNLVNWIKIYTCNVMLLHHYIL